MKITKLPPFNGEEKPDCPFRARVVEEIIAKLEAQERITQMR